MKTLFFITCLLYGAYYYATRHYEFHDTLLYAQKHPESKLSAPVEYYVGVIYYERSDFPKAQEAFSALLEQHPTDYYVAGALLPLDEAAESNADWETAKLALQKYIDDYPNGPKIELARSRLDLLKYHHP